ncbi:hypothetical protein [Tsukamurella pseudospumae]|uniref:Minor tail protein n=1 Tax=Tsukamurella pseudospumae TaxID=239498 RepID=A0A137ZRW3_9ACTN|nr:hypothetical protein [Tsukamurella pseudospumae]KXP00916.1 hypothetical protein AXK61_12975 [Tsukamurella pseudospumae]
MARPRPASLPADLPEPARLAARPGAARLIVAAPRAAHTVRVIVPRLAPPRLTARRPRAAVAVPVPAVRVAVAVPRAPSASVGRPAVWVTVARPRVAVEVCAPPIWWRILAEYAATASFGADLTAAMSVATELSAAGRLTAEVEQSMTHAATLAAAGKLTAALAQHYVAAPLMGCMAKFSAAVAQRYNSSISARAAAAMTAQATEAMNAGQTVPIAATMSVACSQLLNAPAAIGAQAAMTCAIAWMDRWEGSRGATTLNHATWTDLCNYTAKGAGTGTVTFTVAHSWGSNGLHWASEQRGIRILVNGVQVASQMQTYTTSSWSTTLTQSGVAVPAGATVQIQGYGETTVYSACRTVTVSSASMTVQGATP